MDRLHFVDSHTAGEPTRVMIEGGPLLGRVPLVEQRRLLQEEFDHFRSTVILEPRGSDVLVGALICEPVDTSCVAGVIFFNNTGYLGMCGHGVMGVAATLFYLRRIGTGISRFETPVGIVEVDVLSPNRFAVDNVPSYRYRKQVQVDVPELGSVVGDIAWGGNWFFLVDEPRFSLLQLNSSQLSTTTMQIRQSLAESGITGAEGQEIDHIELFGEPTTEVANSQGFVMCPGGAYDRSPCGTGTSAKLACLAADGVLQPNETWVQESIIGSTFEARYQRLDDDRILPTITGEAFVTAEGMLLSAANDPFRHGISVGSES